VAAGGGYFHDSARDDREPDHSPVGEGVRQGLSDRLWRRLLARVRPKVVGRGELPASGDHHPRPSDGRALNAAVKLYEPFGGHLSIVSIP
jgi:hypothetical protein